MNKHMRRSFCFLMLAVTAGCANPSIEEPLELEPIAPDPAGEGALTTSAPSSQSASSEPSDTSPPPLSTETSAASSQIEFDPDGLSIGQGAGFTVLDDPAVIPGTQATWLAPEELILGVTVGDEARAYPISQMAYHHIANDQINGEPYLVTY